MPIRASRPAGSSRNSRLRPVDGGVAGGPAVAQEQEVSEAGAGSDRGCGYRAHPILRPNPAARSATSGPPSSGGTARWRSPHAERPAGIIIHKGGALRRLRKGDHPALVVDAAAREPRRSTTQPPTSCTRPCAARWRARQGRRASLGGPDRLRFDFTHFSLVDPETSIGSNLWSTSASGHVSTRMKRWRRRRPSRPGPCSF